MPYTRGMRTLAVSFALVLGSVAFASFDLMLLGDNTTAGAQRVMRYDPVNRVQLGYFGQGFLNAPVADIAVDRFTNRAFVLQSNGGVRVFNYSTGDFIDGFETNSFMGAITYDSTYNRLTVGNGSGEGTSQAKAYDASSFMVVATFTGSYFSTAPLRRPGTSWYASFGIDLGVTNVLALQHSFSGGPAIDSSFVGAYSSGNTPREAIFTADNRLMGIATNSGANTTQLWTIATDASGFVGATNIGLSIYSSSQNADIANGHGNLAYILVGSTILTYHTGLNQVMGTQAISGTSYQGMAVVIAPEPGTMIALVAGVGALLRRRRRS